MRDLQAGLVSLQQRAAELSKSVAETSRNLEAEERWKTLFTAKGDVLAETVIEAFRELGAKAEPGAQAGMILSSNSMASTPWSRSRVRKARPQKQNAAQLEKWVAGFKAERGSDPKGILLVNAHCETPLSERAAPAFPHQMLKYSCQREHCLVTAAQLLGLLLTARAHPEKRIDLVNSLFSTVGIYRDFSDYRALLDSAAAAP